MKTLLIISTLVLAGCASTPALVQPEPIAVKQIEYVVRIPPAELMTLPAVPAKIDVDTAKQSDAAKMLIESEDTINALKNQLIGIASFFSSESIKLQAEANKTNAESMKAAQDLQGNSAVSDTIPPAK